MSEGLSKKERTELRRAKAAARIGAEKARERRRRRMMQGGVVLAAVAVVAGIGALAVNNRSEPISPSGPVPAAANIFGGVNTKAPLAEGLSVDTADIPEAVDGTPPGISTPAEGEPASVVLYVDANCVHCAEFEDYYGEILKQKAEDGAISLETRAIAILDRNSPTNYSSRAANAMACVADAAPEKYLEFTGAVFENFPSGELANQGLIDLAGEHGVDGIGDCVKEGDFRPFVKFTTEAATEHGITGTPTVFINGEAWDMQGDFEAALNDAIAG